MSSGRQPLPFGHSANAAVDIEGLSVCIATRSYLLLGINRLS